MTPKESYVLWLLSGKALCIHCSARAIPTGYYMHCSECDWNLHGMSGGKCEYSEEIERNRERNKVR